ncbi:MAG: 3-dehydroquinate synthase [Candidatus Scalindua sp.]|nr:3-dehydroquinate synthase [Candidatus Scalindua sp.]
MKNVQLNLDKYSYQVVIEKGILSQVGTLTSKIIKPGKAVVVTDTTVESLYAKTLLESLSKTNFDVKLVSIEPGEEKKSITMAQNLYEALFDHKVDRKSTIFALGGGVIGDLTGFVAATFMRGVPFVQIPTTLLSQVDSSVGGKVAVNHPRGKNMIGCFYQPKAVFIDTDTLKTLPKEEMVAGMVEVIKYGMIRDPSFFAYLETHLPQILELDDTSLGEIVYNSCRNKAEIVEIDEKEEGIRAILNYGHTIGHALETLTSFKKYRHGEAVAIGMIYATKIAISMDLTDETVLERQETLLKRLGLSLTYHALNPHDIVRTLYQDKKTIGGKLRFVLPTKVGTVIISDKPDDATILNSITSNSISIQL